MFVLPKYSDVLKEGKAFVDKLTVPIKAMQGKKQVEMLILQIEEKQANIEIKINGLFDAVPFDAKAVYGLKNEHDLLGREKTFYEELLKTSF